MRKWVTLNGKRLSVLVKPSKSIGSSLYSEDQADEYGYLPKGTPLSFVPWAHLWPDGKIRKSGKIIGIVKDLTDEG